MDPFDAYSRAHWRYSQEQPYVCAHAGGEIRKLDGREFVVLSGRHHPVKAYEILDICLRTASAADFACILAGRGALQHQG
jgi:hypothetical protein